MPTQDKKTKLWTGNVQRRGYPRRIRKGFTTKTAAKEWERITWQDMTRPATKTPITFSQASSEYLTWCEKRRKLNTYRQKIFILKGLITSIGIDLPATEVSKVHIESYLDQRFNDDGGKAANRDLRELSTVFNWFISRELCLVNPCKGIEPYKTEAFLKYVPPPEDINAVLLQANEFEYDFIQCLYHLAARRSEIQFMKWDDVNFTTGTVTLYTAKRKTGSPEPDEMAMNAVLFEILQRRYQTRDRHTVFVFGSKSKNTLDKIMPRLCERAEVKPFGFHAIRHHVAAVMADSKKLSLIEIQKQLRHKRATTTDVYLKSLVTGENRAASVLENAQKNVFHTKVHTLPIKKGLKVDDTKP